MAGLVTDAAITATACHLCYLAEYLVGVVFFNEEVNMATKHKMVTNLEQEKPICSCHLKGAPEIRVGLEEFVT